MVGSRMSDQIDYDGLGLDRSKKGEHVDLFEDAYIGDDYDAWIQTHNPRGLPVVHLETPADQFDRHRIGGWLLREKTSNGDWPKKVPLNAPNHPGGEPQARAEAKARIALRDGK